MSENMEYFNPNDILNEPLGEEFIKEQSEIASEDRSTDEHDIDQSHSKNKFFNRRKKTNDRTGGKFVALGASMVGKTCYITGAFDRINGGISNANGDNESENPYSIQLFDAAEIQLMDTYINNMHNENKVTVPDPTDEQIEFDFTFNHNLRSVETFQWIDYKGGVLKEKGSASSSSNKFLTKVINADVIFSFVNGDDFLTEDISDPKEYENFIVNKIKFNCRDQSYFIESYVKKKKVQPPVAIIITKCDKVRPHFIKIYNTSDEDIITEKINKIIRAVFPNLFSIDRIESDPKSLVGIFPISVISEENGTKRYCPINVQGPLYFGLCNVLYINRYDGKEKEEIFKKMCEKQIDSTSEFFRCYLNGIYQPKKKFEEMVKEFYSGRKGDFQRGLHRKLW